MLIPNWKDAWKFISVRAMAGAAGLQLFAIEYPALVARMSDRWFHGITAVVLLYAIFGRVQDQKKA